MIRRFSERVLFIAVFVAACARPAQVPTPLVNHSFADVAGGIKTPDRFWTVFEDDTLDALVSRALSRNYSLEAAWQSFRAAAALASREGAGRIPTVNFFVESEVEQPRRLSFEYFRTGLAAAYEIDLWGRIGDRAKAARHRAEASQLDYHTAAISLAAQVTILWLHIHETSAQLALLDKQIETNTTVVTLLENRLGTSLVKQVDILRQRRLVTAAKSERLAQQLRLTTLRNQLSVLVGQAPTSSAIMATRALPQLPPPPRLGVSSDLLKRRPDIRSAHQRVFAADREVAGAIAERFPRISFAASVSTGEGRANSIFKDWFANLVGNLVLPLIDGGARRAEVDRMRALRKQQVALYAQTVLIAVREVEDALAAEYNQRALLQNLTEQLRLATASYQRLQIEYFNGGVGYIDVLTALNDKQTLDRQRLSTQRQLLENRVQLYRALADGFATKREDSQ